MRYKCHIAFANREDLMREAVESARGIGNIHIWANGGMKSPLDIQNVTHHELPPVAWTTVANMMIQSSWEDDVMFWMHNDGFAEGKSAAKFLANTEAMVADAQCAGSHHDPNSQDKTPGKWGVVFTEYDVLCAFNMNAVRDTGYWDPIYFQYVAEVDYYRAMLAKGWSVTSDNSVKQYIKHRHHQGLPQNAGSNTIKADPLFNYRTQFRNRTGFDDAYFALKWGTRWAAWSDIKQGFTEPFADFQPINNEFIGKTWGDAPDSQKLQHLPSWTKERCQGQHRFTAQPVTRTQQRFMRHQHPPQQRILAEQRAAHVNEQHRILQAKGLKA